MIAVTKELTCIVCPNGCRLTVTDEGGELKVSGATCKRGEAFGKSEVLNPTRSITSTVATKFKDFPLLPVKTAGEIPKDKIFEAMKLINAVKVTKRLKTGDVIIDDFFGAKLVATTDMARLPKENRIREAE